MYPARLRLLHSRLSVRLVVVDSLDVPKGRASNAVHDNEDDEHNDVDDRDLPPARLQAG